MEVASEAAERAAALEAESEATLGGSLVTEEVLAPVLVDRAAVSVVRAD